MPAGGTDGRLELDELGRAVDSATELDLVGEDHPDEPTWGERVAESRAGRWWEGHPWARRSIIGVAVVAVVGLALSWTGEAPPDDLEVVATVESDGGEVGTDLIGGTVQAGFVVTDVRPGDDVTVKAVVGPGLRSATSRDLGGGRVVVQAVLDCGEADALDAPADRYGLRVSRTDQWGRTVVESRPLPEGADWSGAVHEACWATTAEQALAVDDVGVVVGPAYAMVRLSVRITSSLPADALVQALPVDDGEVGVVLVDSASLPAGGTVDLDVPLRVRSCDSPQVPRWASTNDVSGGYSALEPGLQLDVTLPASGESRLTSIRFDEAQARAIQEGLDQVCAGVPRTTISLVDVGRAQLSGAVVLMPVTLDIRSEGLARRVLVESDDLYGEAIPKPVGRGGRVDGTWAFFCQESVSPMSVSLQVNADGRDYPWRWSSEDPRLVREVQRVCPGAQAPTTFVS
jgi:hypothetical protein